MSSKTNIEQIIQTLKVDNQKLMKENASLKRKIGGFKTSNDRYKKQAENDALRIKSLQKDLENCKQAQGEVDLIEAARENQEISSLTATVEEKFRVISGLQSQIDELNKLIAKNERDIQTLKVERDAAIAKYDYVCGMPWYKRMFFKGK